MNNFRRIFWGRPAPPSFKIFQAHSANEKFIAGKWRQYKLWLSMRSELVCKGSPVYLYGIAVALSKMIGRTSASSAAKLSC
jgi:predicted transcriptional regulator